MSTKQVDITFDVCTTKTEYPGDVVQLLPKKVMVGKVVIETIDDLLLQIIDRLNNPTWEDTDGFEEID